MKKLLVISLVLVLSLCLVMPVSAKKARVLKYSSIHEPTHVASITADVFAARVNQMTNGELDVQVYHSRQLGDARQNVENIRNGSIAFTSVSVANLSQVIPAMDMFSLPYIFKNDTHYWYCIQHPKIEKFMAQLDTCRPKGYEDPGHGFSGDDQYHEGDRGKRRSHRLGGTLQRPSDRCCGWCREQPAVSDLDEVL